MKTPVCRIGTSFLILLISVSAYAQEKNPLINSGEILKKGLQKQSEGKYAESIALFNQINRSDTNYVHAIYELSNSYFMDSQYVKSLEAARTGLRNFPDKFSSFSMMVANSLDELKMLKEAQAEYEAAIKRNPHNYLLYYNQGITNFNQKDYAQAKKSFRQSLLINPFYAKSHFFLASVSLKEGDLIPAILGYSTYLMIEPAGKLKPNAISILTSIAKATDEILDVVKNRPPGGDKTYNAIQDILLSKIAIDENYKSMVDIEDPMIKQLQVVSEKLEYNKRDTGFTMQYYVPFFSKMYKEKKFEPQIYTMFSDVDLASIKNWNKKNQKKVEAFATEAYEYFEMIRSTRILDLESRPLSKQKYIYNNNKLIARGIYIPKGKDYLQIGKWEFYNAEGGLSNEGSFTNEGEKDGLWISYYENGKVKEKNTYKRNKGNGVSEGWFQNGNKWYDETLKDGLIEGVQNINYYNDKRKNVFRYANDKKNGIQEYYYNTGVKSSTYTYKDDKLEGEAKEFYRTGKLKNETFYKNNEENGEYKSYYETGELYAKGLVKDGKRQGLWTHYYKNGKESSKVTYLDNEVTGEYTEYYDNGKLKSTGSYVKKKIDGKITSYADDGIMYSTSVYDKGKLKEISFFDKEGKQIATTTTRKGAATILFYSADGLKTSEGKFDKDGNQQGKFQTFYSNGVVREESNWKDGEKHGSYKSFYPSGTLRQETYYKNGIEDGYSKSYYINGNLSKEGWVVNDMKQQTWIIYNVAGDVYRKEYYLDGELDGYVQTYYPGNILDYEFVYHKGWNEGMTQYDTTGNILQQNTFENGSGVLTFRHLNKNILSEVPFKHYMNNGLRKNYFFDGSLSSSSTFLNDEYDGEFIKYSYGGKKSVEGQYVSGKKNGEWKYYFDNGQMSSKLFYKHGELDGLATYYSKTGRIEETISYNDGEMQGPWTFYGDNNEIAVVLNYSSDEFRSYQFMGKDGKLGEPVKMRSSSGKVSAFYANGTPSAIFDFVDNNINGDFKLFYSNGKVMIEGNRLNGYKMGKQKKYYPDGKLYREENFILGNLYGNARHFYPDGKIEREAMFYDDETHGTDIHYDSKGKAATFQCYYGYILSIKK